MLPIRHVPSGSRMAGTRARMTRTLPAHPPEVRFNAVNVILDAVRRIYPDYQTGPYIPPGIFGPPPRPITFLGRGSRGFSPRRDIMFEKIYSLRLFC